jgi:hypothetical protein
VDSPPDWQRGVASALHSIVGLEYRQIGRRIKMDKGPIESMSWNKVPTEPILPKNQWQKFPIGLPFADARLIGITQVQDKPIRVVDWALVQDYYEKGKYHDGGFALVVIDTDEGEYKIKLDNNPFMNGTLKNQKQPFNTIIRRVSSGFIFADMGSKKPYRRL